MNRNIIRMILMIMTITICVIIFRFSSQSGEESSSLSGGILTKVIDHFFLTKELSQEQRLVIVQELHTITRKVAHFSIYTLLGSCLISLMYTFSIRQKQRMGYSLLIGIFYACIDEFHQSWIPGRSAEIRDVMIDSAGVIAGVFLVWAIYTIIQKIKYRNRRKGYEK